MKMNLNPCKFEKCPKKESCIDYDMNCYRCKVYKAYVMGVEDGENEVEGKFKKKIAEVTKETNNLKDTIKRMGDTIEEMQEVIDYFNEQYCGR